MLRRRIFDIVEDFQIAQCRCVEGRRRHVCPIWNRLQEFVDLPIVCSTRMIQSDVERSPSERRGRKAGERHDQCEEQRQTRKEDMFGKCLYQLRQIQQRQIE